ncbi:hypothetical protein BDQ12DRAFT_665199 [Crucibulum laeve]|uniref:Uncharacterized protein n=1 Tax=Crucibulum laeve TaxID=68775 RepID=A0A5C3M5J2_9AGAR|nr:hypothetical protein BDQ12DRAFT_665199 [Crucibulum laeve]
MPDHQPHHNEHKGEHTKHREARRASGGGRRGSEPNRVKEAGASRSHSKWHASTSKLKDDTQEDEDKTDTFTTTLQLIIEKIKILGGSKRHPRSNIVVAKAVSLAVETAVKMTTTAARMTDQSAAALHEASELYKDAIKEAVKRMVETATAKNASQFPTTGNATYASVAATYADLLVHATTGHTKKQL